MEILKDVRAVVMDLDDTLISAYRRPDLVWRVACQRFRSELGVLEPDEAAHALTRAGAAFRDNPDRHALGRLDPAGARRIIVAEAFRTLGEGGRRPPSPQIGELMADAFSLQRDRDMRLEPGAVAVLVHLREAGYGLALLTNGTGPLQRAKIERFDLTSRFHHIQIEGEVGLGKPDPAAFIKVFEALAVHPAAVCMVGDSLEGDIRPSRMLAAARLFTIPMRRTETRRIGLRRITSCRPSTASSSISRDRAVESRRQSDRRGASGHARLWPRFQPGLARIA